MLNSVGKHRRIAVLQNQNLHALVNMSDYVVELVMTTHRYCHDFVQLVHVKITFLLELV